VKVRLSDEHKESELPAEAETGAQAQADAERDANDMGGAEGGEQVKLEHTYFVVLQKNAEEPIRVQDIAMKLSAKGVKLNDCQLLYYSNPDQLFVYLGLYTESHSDLVVPNQGHEITLKCRRNIYHEPLPRPSSESHNSGRGNERMINDVIRLVYQWKKLQEPMCGLSVEEAAQRVGVSKKTLDDYCRQLRDGKKNNFDFNLYRNHLMGLLRGFNSGVAEKEARKAAKG
jgi:hypothetical protein